MRLQALRKVGVELQSNPNDTDVTRNGCGGYDAQTNIESKSGVDEHDGEQVDGLVNEEEELDDEQKVVGSVDNTIADDSTSRVVVDRIDDKVRDTGLRTVRSLVNGGLAILALGALSPVGLLLKHLDGLKEEERGEEERTEDGNDS
jgi:hypothetical protein